MSLWVCVCHGQKKISHWFYCLTCKVCVSFYYCFTRKKRNNLQMILEGFFFQWYTTHTFLIFLLLTCYHTPLQQQLPWILFKTFVFVFVKKKKDSPKTQYIITTCYLNGPVSFIIAFKEKIGSKTIWLCGRVGTRRNSWWAKLFFYSRPRASWRPWEQVFVVEERTSVWVYEDGKFHNFSSLMTSQHKF